MIQRRSLLLGAACLAALGAAPALLAAEAPDPFKFVVDLTNGILDEIRKDPALHAAQADRVRSLVEERIMPSADFTMMTRMTGGPQWRKATDAQRTALQAGFKELLIKVYSGALRSVTDQRCELRPTRVKTVRDEMVIRTLLKSAERADIGIDYRVYRTKNNEWKVVDVNVEGIWMVENYRSQFAAVLGRDGIDGLVKMLEEKSEELAERNKPDLDKKDS